MYALVEKLRYQLNEIVVLSVSHYLISIVLVSCLDLGHQFLFYLQIYMHTFAGSYCRSHQGCREHYYILNTALITT